MDGIKGATIALSVSALLAVTGCSSSDQEMPGEQSDKLMSGGATRVLGTVLHRKFSVVRG